MLTHKEKIIERSGFESEDLLAQGLRMQDSRDAANRQIKKLEGVIDN